MKQTLPLILCLVAPALAQPRAIDAANSVMNVHVSKSGVLSALGHNHEISAPITAGKVDVTAHTVELRVAAKSLKVDDPGVSDKDRAEIQSTMLGPEVLDAAQFPDISFRSTTAESSGTGAWKVQGELEVHGQHHPVTVEVRESGGQYEGSCTFKQTDFGIKPVKAGGGAVKVKDELRIDFKIRLSH